MSVWLLALLPVLPIGLVFLTNQLPDVARGSSVSLVGPWKAHEVVEGFDAFAPSTDGWRDCKLPGSFQAQGLPPHVWLRKTFVPPEPTIGHDAVFIIGGVRGATARLYFNGQAIGTRGHPETNFLGVESGAETLFIPAALVHGGDNTLTIEVIPLEHGRDGITDPRLMFGQRELLGPWSFAEQQLRAVLEQGVVVVIAFLALLLGALWVLQGGRLDRDLYRATLGVLGAAALYLVSKSGFVISSVMSSHNQLRVVVSSVFVLGLFIGEFVEAYFLRRQSWFRAVNRVVSLAALAVTLVSFQQVVWVYPIFSVWLFTIVFYSLALAVRDLVRTKTLLGPMVTTANLIVAAAGVNDLLCDLDVLYSPRLFTFSVANLAIMCGAVVVGEFLQLARENARLSTSLTLRAEELVAALSKAEEASRVKSEFLANTSHELRTPLNAIINIPQGILEQFHETQRARCAQCASLFELEPGEVPPETCPECRARALTVESKLTTALGTEETARLLKSIVRSGNHLLAVVNDILDYSKLEAGRVVLHKEQVTVGGLLEDLRLAMEPVATRAGVALALELQAPGVLLDIDRVKLTQVLINLVGNAIKFSDGKGTVTVGARVTASQVVLSVHDDGIGIAPENLSLIFEGFRQVEGSNTRRFGGTGLGLAISRRLVTMHHGTLRVESTMGAGSTFFVELPLNGGPDEAGPHDAEVVVVVDDEASALDTTAMALKPLGCRIIAVTDPRDALTRLKETHPRLVVLDVMMPRVSGLEVLRAIQADPVLKHVPVLVSSAYPDNRPSVEATGATFIDKPWRAGELLRVVSGLMAVKRSADAPDGKAP